MKKIQGSLREIPHFTGAHPVTPVEKNFAAAAPLLFTFRQFSFVPLAVQLASRAYGADQTVRLTRKGYSRLVSENGRKVIRQCANMAPRVTWMKSEIY